MHRQLAAFKALSHGVSLAASAADMKSLSEKAAMRKPIDQRTGAQGALTEQVESCLRKLTRRERQILRMRFGIGTERRQVNEIGERLGIATATVRRFHRRGLQRLRLLAIAGARLPHSTSMRQLRPRGSELLRRRGRRQQGEAEAARNGKGFAPAAEAQAR